MVAYQTAYFKLPLHQGWRRFLTSVLDNSDKGGGVYQRVQGLRHCAAAADINCSADRFTVEEEVSLRPGGHQNIGRGFIQAVMRQRGRHLPLRISATG